VQRLQLGGCPADPMGQRRALDLDTLARQTLTLPLQWKMIGVFADHHLGDERLGRQPAGDQPRRCRRLDHPRDVVGAILLAASAGEFRPVRLDHTQLSRHDIKALGDILSDDVQRAAAARTSLVLRFDHLRHMRQVIEVGGTAARAALATPSGVRGFTGLLGLVFSLISFGFRLGETGLELFQHQRQLIVVDFLRLATERSAPDFGYDRLKATIAGLQLVTLGADRITLIDGGITFVDGRITLGDKLRAQRVDIVGKYVADVRHSPYRLAEDEPCCC
jgi:hypothetical protein